MDTSGGPVQQRQSRIEPYLPKGNTPRPIKYLIAAVLWPVMGVLAILGGAAGLALALMALVLVVGIIIVAVTGGLEGGRYLVQHPAAVLPHAVATKQLL